MGRVLLVFGLVSLHKPIHLNQQSSVSLNQHHSLISLIPLLNYHLSCEVGSWFMNFATIKTVLDHR